MATDDKQASTGTPVERHYDMRLASRHAGDDNQLIGLDFELRRRGEDWAPFELDALGSPFLNFLHSAVVCQLAYLRMNAAERGLRLSRVHGLCECETTDFRLERLVVSFAIGLDGGEADDDDLAYLRERCLACPVSRNLAHATKDTVVVVGAEPVLSLFRHWAVDVVPV